MTLRQASKDLVDRLAQIGRNDTVKPTATASLHHHTPPKVGAVKEASSRTPKASNAKINKVDGQCEKLAFVTPTSSIKHLTPRLSSKKKQWKLPSASEVRVIKDTNDINAFMTISSANTAHPHEYRRRSRTKTMSFCNKSTLPQSVSSKVAHIKKEDRDEFEVDESSAAHQTPFPEVVHAMVSDTSQTDPSVIDWIKDGEAFVIYDKGRKLSPILQKFFRHSKYSSLQRQLNMYGWKKCVTGKYKGGFYHPDFHRDCDTPAELSIIKRRPPPGKSSMTSLLAPTTLSPKKKKTKRPAKSSFHPMRSPTTKRRAFVAACKGLVKEESHSEDEEYLLSPKKKRSTDMEIRLSNMSVIPLISTQDVMSPTPSCNALLMHTPQTLGSSQDLPSLSPCEYWSPLIKTCCDSDDPPKLIEESTELLSPPRLPTRATTAKITGDGARQMDVTLDTFNAEKHDQIEWVKEFHDPEDESPELVPNKTNGSTGDINFTLSPIRRRSSSNNIGIAGNAASSRANVCFLGQAQVDDHQFGEVSGPALFTPERLIQPAISFCNSTNTFTPSPAFLNDQINQELFTPSPYLPYRVRYEFRPALNRSDSAKSDQESSTSTATADLRCDEELDSLTPENKKEYWLIPQAVPCYLF